MRKWLILAVLAAAGVLGVLMRPPVHAPPPPDPVLAACRAAQQAVTQRLKTVAYPHFPPCTDVRIRRTGTGRWQVEGRFDADFLFGENARTGYAATVEQRAGRFDVTDLKIWP